MKRHTIQLVRGLSLAMAFTTLAAPPTLSAPPARAEKPADAKIIPVAMYVDQGVSGKGPEMLDDKFYKDTEFRIIGLRAGDIRERKLKGFRVLIVPGGSGKGVATALGEEGRTAIKEFVENGGTYVGICAGCYLASCQYDWSLHILPAKLKDTANWERGRAILAITLTKDGKQWFGRTQDEVKTMYHNGPVLEPSPEAKDTLIPLAIYKEEVTRKGAKDGLMVNTPAITANRYGQGWVISISPHPEQTPDLKDLVPEAIRWAMKSPMKK